MRTVVVTSCRPHIRPLMYASGAALKVSELHGGLLDEASENRRRFHRVGVVIPAVACVLVGLHLAGVRAFRGAVPMQNRNSARCLPARGAGIFPEGAKPTWQYA